MNDYLEEEFEAPQDFCDQCGVENTTLSLLEVDGVEMWLCPVCLENTRD